MRHIVPNAVFSTMVLASLDVGAIVLTFAALSFLGVGTDIGYADWGQIVSFARDYILSLDQYWYIVFFPGMALIIFGLGWNLIGDALRDILDPECEAVAGLKNAVDWGLRIKVRRCKRGLVFNLQSLTLPLRREARDSALHVFSLL